MTEEKPFDYSFLDLTPEKEQEIREEQAERAQAFHGRGELSERERMLGRGAALEALARRNLSLLESEKRRRHRAYHTPERRAYWRDQLADALALQGRYPEAIKAVSDNYKRREFKKILAAINKPDHEVCRCRPDESNLNGDMQGEFEVTPHFVRIEHVISFRHGGEAVALIACRKCGQWNARPLSGAGQVEHIYHAHRAGARAAHAGQSFNNGHHLIRKAS